VCSIILSEVIGMTTINATIIPDAEAWLKENIKDMSSDSVSAVYVTGINTDFSITLFDEEEGQKKSFTLEQQVVALQKLADEIAGKRLFVGCLKSPTQLADPCNWDVEVADAFFQLVYHGEVIYG
jgi:hypothetical protein